MTRYLHMHVQLHMDAKCAFTIYLGGNGHASPETSPPVVCSHCSTCAHISVETFASLLDTIFAKPLKEVLATTGFSLGAQRKYPTKHAHTNPSHWRPLSRAGNYLRQLFLETMPRTSDGHEPSSARTARRAKPFISLRPPPFPQICSISSSARCPLPAGHRRNRSGTFL